MPPSATATDYDAGYAHQLMEDLNMSAGGAFKRAVGALLTLFAGVRGIIRPRPARSKRDTAQRFLIWFGAVIFGTATLSAFPIPQSWPMAGGLGGWVGDSLYLNAKGALDHFNFPISGVVVAV